MSKMRGLVKYAGGKTRISPWLIENFPPDYENMIYIEPFLGGGSVLLNKKPSVLEYANDLDYALYNLWDQLQVNYITLSKRLSQEKYEVATFERAAQYVNMLPSCQIPGVIYGLEEAASYYIVKRMSRGGLGKDFAWSDRKRGGKPGDVNAWETALANLGKISKRVEDVRFECKDAITYISPLVDKLSRSVFSCYPIFIYVDCPYLHSTRKSKKLYQHEFSEQQHIELANVLNNLPKNVNIMISGYESTLYHAIYPTWKVIKKEFICDAGQTKKKTKRVEQIWINY
jgi:DNA adenine methylase